MFEAKTKGREPGTPPPAEELEAVVREPGSFARLEVPKDEDFWVFGYGSLMWDPGFPFKEARPALLRGYHRRFCVYSHRYRGTPQRPGLVLGLDQGGSCHGMAYRICCTTTEQVLDYLWEREMITGVYHPRWLKLDLEFGRVEAVGFVVDRAHVQYTGKMTPETTAGLILQGHGRRGACHDYLRNTVRHLEQLGIHDRALSHLLDIVEDRRAG